MTRALAGAMTLVLASAGCSYTAMTRPPSGPAAEHASDCDDELGMPFGDFVFAGAFGFIGYAGLTDLFELQIHGTDHDDQIKTTYGIGGAVLAVVFAVSGVIGTRWARQCKVVHHEHRRSLAAQDPEAGRPGHVCRENGSCDYGLPCERDQCGVSP